MYCPKCGAENLEDATICQQCGGVFIHSKPARISGMAITSMILGISGFSMLGVFGITWIIGLIFGIIALNKIGKSAGQLKGKGFAITGIVTSSVGLAIVLTVIGIVLLVNSATTISLYKKFKTSDEWLYAEQVKGRPVYEGLVCVEDKLQPAEACQNTLFVAAQSDVNFVPLVVSITCKQKDSEPIRLSWQFVGNKKKADVYRFSLSFPIGEGVFATTKKKIFYDGTERVIYEDGRHRIYIRPID